MESNLEQKNSLGKENINYVIIESARSQMYRFMKYWGKKPHNIFREYIDTYSNPNEVVLDPFSGSGVCPLEGVQIGRKVIGIDINPIAIFITQMIARPFHEKKFMEVYNSLDSKMREFDENEKLFKTKCESCGRLANISSVHYEDNSPVNEDNFSHTF
jgi:adenine specific DNA methylase Mod